MSNQKLNLCVLSGSFEYDSEPSLEAFGTYLEANHRVVPVTIVYKTEDDDASLAAIDGADVVLVFTRRLNTVGRELERFKSYCARGGPIVGVRTASHAFQNWLEFDRGVLGGNYEGHYGAGPVCHVELVPGTEDHPILNGVSPFDSEGSLYQNTPIAADAMRLLNGLTEDEAEPVAWTRYHNGGRVFYTSLGHQADFRNDEFLNMLSNAVFWAAGKDHAGGA